MGNTLRIAYSGALRSIYFPDREYRILRKVYKADFAAITVQLDNTSIGDQRTYSKDVLPQSTHYVVMDFRRLEGKYSPFGTVAKSIANQRDERSRHATASTTMSVAST